MESHSEIRKSSGSISNGGSKILAFSCSGPVHEMTRKRLVTEIGPRLVQLRDRVHATLGGVF
jgi:DNA-binding IclR family transcriptional regulator